jgi:SAM-dependent methyltransferase
MISAIVCSSSYAGMTTDRHREDDGTGVALTGADTGRDAIKRTLADAPAPYSARMTSTDAAYARRLAHLERRWWKRLVPNPYRWHIRRRCPGRVLDVGCGIGRCLGFLEGRGVGVDPNEAAVATARDRGFEAYTPEELDARADLDDFDTLLCSHVLEHLDRSTAIELLSTWLARLRPGGRVVLICPQARGQASDPTHVRLMDADALREVCSAAGIAVTSIRSFPIPAWCGRLWVHNETVLVGSRRG